MISDDFKKELNAQFKISNRLLIILYVGILMCNIVSRLYLKRINTLRV